MKASATATALCVCVCGGVHFRDHVRLSVPGEAGLAVCVVIVFLSVYVCVEEGGP